MSDQRFSNVIELVDDNYAEFIDGLEDPILIDFSAEWCPPCKVMAPIFETLADTRIDGLCYASINTDKNQKAAADFEITSIPTFVMLSKTGEELGRAIGAMSAKEMAAWIDATVPAGKLDDDTSTL